MVNHVGLVRHTILLFAGKYEKIFWLLMTWAPNKGEFVGSILYKSEQRQTNSEGWSWALLEEKPVF